MVQEQDRGDAARASTDADELDPVEDDAPQDRGNNKLTLGSFFELLGFGLGAAVPSSVEFDRERKVPLRCADGWMLGDARAATAEAPIGLLRRSDQLPRSCRARSLAAKCHHNRMQMMFAGPEARFRE